MYEVHRLSAKLGRHEITIETGKLAKQANSVIVTTGESVLMVNAVCGAHNPEKSFFPLVVDYIEKAYAGGRIPGGFLRREGRLSDHEVLASRLTDRPIRPLFPEGYKGETQITATVLSHDGNNDTDILCITGASAALMISEAPFFGPIAGVRVGRIDGELIANPSNDELKRSDLAIVMACSKEAIVMVEGEANQLPEAEIVEALDFGFAAVQPLLDLQIELARRAGKPKMEFEAITVDKAIKAAVVKAASDRTAEALAIREKHSRYGTLKVIAADLVATLGEKFPDRTGEIKDAFEELKSDIMRRWVVNDRRRIDGRGLRDIRPIWTEVGVLPRVHGSSVFTRGETQALVAVTLGTERDAQLIEGLNGRHDDTFMLHYNFPPFSVGEIKPLRGPGRREVGHGFLAKRGIAKMLPKFEDFPYVVRIVSEVLESNGSSSMATACGGSMALMNAGVPLEAPVAGIAMGLIAEGGKFAVLSDILGDEDHLGDMDFKVVGTSKGVTALQMDIKITGLPREVMVSALDQAREGRLHILGEMAKSIAAPADDLSKYAPRITTIKISVDRIRDVIGSGGKTIRSIQERTGCTVNVMDDGTVKIASSDQGAARECVEIIESLTAEPLVGEIYLGQVAKVMEFGAFVTILPGVDGLCHISELTEERVERVEDICREGDEIVVKCLGVERNGKIRLSRKDALGKEPTVQGLKLKL
ncbi:MAG: polyribonucleotide nucleotidyltransferase [Myxococcales bacterium]|nr:polyribonucleotide nucleotidyltransferase [Myxococcales bacterium]MCB9521359.1 polyribonucleotide nucleotidyltransferase [Myxococcales bacterium]